MTSQMLIRLSSETKEKLDRVARNQGKSTSQVVRELINDYIQDRDIGVYIDDLWSRIGKKLKSKGIYHKDIPEMVRQVRESKK
ncbi:MAG: ribbon-helix-helix protein, CopG family [Candidatus Aminicenantes bacterium]|nr:ribbon-helix-helix protein, CopG family [Candidatus Aminicenantes bacterium]